MVRAKPSAKQQALLRSLIMNGRTMQKGDRTVLQMCLGFAGDSATLPWPKRNLATCRQCVQCAHSSTPGHQRPHRRPDHASWRVCIQHTNGHRRADSLWAHGVLHAEHIDVAHIVAKVDHSLEAMLIDQSVDAFALIGHQWWKQLTGELSATIAQAMRLGDTVYAIV